MAVYCDRGAGFPGRMRVRFMTTGKGPYDKECSCGGAWEELEWCKLHNEVCVMGDYYAVKIFIKTGCPHVKEKFRCRKCGVMVDIQ